MFNCEVQRDDGEADVRRARFHSAMLDTRMLRSNESFKRMKNSYVIFITEKDHFKLGKPVYHIERTITDIARPFGDGNHIIYVNGAYRGDDALGRMLEDFRNRTVEGFNNRILEEGVRHFKIDEGGRDIMCKAVEKYAKGKYTEGIEQGIEAFVLDKIEDSVSRSEILARLMKRFKLTEQEAEKYYEKYASAAV